MVGSGQSSFRTQPAVADVHQRLRVAADRLYKDLLSAGAGPYLGVNPGPLSALLPPVRPHRQGAIDADSDLSYAPDRITIIHVPRTSAQTLLSADMGDATEDLNIYTTSPGCPASGIADPCNFEVGMRGLIFDASGIGAGYDLFTMTTVGTSDLGHGGFNPSFSRTYAANDARITEINQHVYYFDQTNAQLRHYDGYETDVILIDDVVDLQFTYFANPDPGSIPAPADGLGNCVYAAGSPPTPILPNLNTPTLTMHRGSAYRRAGLRAQPQPVRRRSAARPEDRGLHHRPGSPCRTPGRRRSAIREQRLRDRPRGARLHDAVRGHAAQHEPLAITGGGETR